MEKQEQRIRSWTSYWATGARHSCTGSFELSGEGGVATFWRRQFAHLAAGATIVDLGTGGGGLLAEARVHPGYQRWRLIGVDQAEAQPMTALDTNDDPGIDLRTATRMEATGLMSGQADLVTSQFGIEYGDAPAVQAECLRLLAPQGRLAFVIHHSASAISQVGRDELATQEQLLGEEGILSLTLALLPHMAAARSGLQPGMEARKALGRFNDAMNHAREMAEVLQAPDLLVEAATFVQRAVSTVSTANRNAVAIRLDAYREALELAKVRTEEQLDAAMDRRQLSAFMEPFQTHGFDIRFTELRESVHLVGWAVEGRAAHGDQSSPNSEAPS